MRIVICDDCREDALALRAMLRGHRVALFSGAEPLLEQLERSDCRYDLYLLDIYMGGELNGIRLARRIRALDADAAICFVSTSDAHYREAYDLQDVNYLLKPVSEEAFRTLIDRCARRSTRHRQQVFSYKWNGRMENIPYGQILYITSSGHALTIVCKGGVVHHCSAKLDDVEALLDGGMFLRCHQSFLVNLYQVDHLSGSDLILGDQCIPISRRYYPAVKQRYQEILFEGVD